MRADGARYWTGKKQKTKHRIHFTTHTKHQLQFSHSSSESNTTLRFFFACETAPTASSSSESLPAVNFCTTLAAEGAGEDSSVEVTEADRFLPPSLGLFEVPCGRASLATIFSRLPISSSSSEMSLTSSELKVVFLGAFFGRRVTRWPPSELSLSLSCCFFLPLPLPLDLELAAEEVAGVGLPFLTLEPVATTGTMTP